MKRLQFAKEYRLLVREGLKTQTIRCWKRPQVVVGDLCRSDGVGILEVTAVDKIELSSLTGGDAKREGFASVGELLSAVRKIYGSGRGGCDFYRVRFRILSTGMLIRKKKSDLRVQCRRKRVAKRSL